MRSKLFIDAKIALHRPPPYEVRASHLLRREVGTCKAHTGGVSFIPFLTAPKK